jgi:hypothetical protein
MRGVNYGIRGWQSIRIGDVMRSAVFGIPAALLLMQLLAANEPSQQRIPPELFAVTDCVGSQVRLQGRPEASPDRRRGWYYRFAKRADVLVRRQLPIVGGLLPGPNIAAQAGYIDPTVAARAFAGAERPIQPISPLKARVARIPLIGRPCS